MTIVTKPLTDEKKDLKPLVVDSDRLTFPAAPPSLADGDGSSTTSLVGVYQLPYRKHRTGFLVCLALLILLTIGCAVMGGIYLYYRFSQPEGYRGSCRIRFNHNDNAQFQPSNPDRLIAPFDLSDSFSQSQSLPTAADFIAPQFPANRKQMQFPAPGEDSLPSLPEHPLDMDLRRIMDSFQQDFELDLRKQLWEILQVPRVPQLGLGRPARFVHDFSLNLTAIFDMQSRECYIMPLNRTVIKPPQDLFQFLRGLEDGSYTVDGSSIRQTYYVDPLPVMDFAPLGPFISKECGSSPTYWLITRDLDNDNSAISDRFRRDLGASQGEKVTFGEFAGSSLHTVNIIKQKV